MGAGIGMAALAYSRKPRSRWDRSVEAAGNLIQTAQKEMKPWMGAAAGTAAAGTALFFLATHHGLLAVTAVITSLYPAVTILLARVLSGERLTSLRIIGLCMAAASVGLIAVG